MSFMNCSRLGLSVLGSMSSMSPEEESSRTNLSAAKIIATVKGSEWLGRHVSIQQIGTPEALRQQLSFDAQENIIDFADQSACANVTEYRHVKNTDYDMLKEWPVNYVRGEGSLDGQWLVLSGLCYNDDAMFRIFHSSRPGSKVLDIVKWIKSRARQGGFVGDSLAMMPDSKISFSAFRWMVVFRRVEAV